MQKQRTSTCGKIQYLEAHVFGNAKLLLIFRIHNFQNSKCFSPKSWISTHLSKKRVKTQVKIVADG